MESVAKTFQRNQQKDHIVIIPSASKSYMTHDIPYPFRQDTDFLYLCGFLEPDSMLVLESSSGSLPEHRASLFVPKKDPHRELWDGPRSGIDGAITLTGVDEAYNMEDFGSYLQNYLKTHKGFVSWYSFSKPVHPVFHLKYITDFLKQNKSGYTESPRGLIQALRLFKSPAEVNLMQKSCDIAGNAFQEVIKYSYPGVSEASVEIF